MSINYQLPSSNAAAQPPAPAPGPGTAVIATLPADGDALSAASVAQPIKALTDAVSWLSIATRQSIPIASSSASLGYGAVTYSSSPAFGGSVVPSGQGASYGPATGTQFSIQIQTGGAVGTATFKTSTDGGNTYGALQTTAASMTDATTGITLAFSGSTTAGGTAIFRSALTPSHAWFDSAGNVRSTVDHNGYRMGRINEIAETFVNVAPGFIISAAGSGPVTGSLFSYTLTGSLNTLSLTSGYNSSFPMQFASLGIPNTSGNGIKLTSNGNFPCGMASTAVVYEWTLELALTSVTNQSVLCGLWDGGSNYAMVRKQNADSAWTFEYANSGTGSAFSTGVAFVTNPTRFRMELHGPASPLGVVSGGVSVAILFINEVLVGVVQSTALLPQVAGGLSFIASFSNTATASAGNIILLSGIRAVWAQYPTISAWL